MESKNALFFVPFGDNFLLFDFPFEDLRSRVFAFLWKLESWSIGMKLALNVLFKMLSPISLGLTGVVVVFVYFQKELI